jgi:hypothetical protein
MILCFDLTLYHILNFPPSFGIGITVEGHVIEMQISDPDTSLVQLFIIS